MNIIIKIIISEDLIISGAVELIFSVLNEFWGP